MHMGECQLKNSGFTISRHIFTAIRISIIRNPITRNPITRKPNRRHRRNPKAMAMAELMLASIGTITRPTRSKLISRTNR